MGFESDLQPLTTYSQSPTQIEEGLRPITNQPPSQPKPMCLIQTVSHPLLLGPENTNTACPFCHSTIRTSVKYTTSSRTHLVAAHFLPICCCCLPYCCNSAKNTDHYCPNCGKYLGTYKK